MRKSILSIALVVLIGALTRSRRDSSSVPKNSGGGPSTYRRRLVIAAARQRCAQREESRDPNDRSARKRSPRPALKSLCRVARR